MVHDVLELFAIAVKLGLVKLAFEEFGDDLILVYAAHFPQWASTGKWRFIGQLPVSRLRSQEWNRDGQQQQHHDNELDGDDVL